jgi:hypothetical protein
LPLGEAASAAVRAATRNRALTGLAAFTAIAALTRPESWQKPLASDTAQYLYVGNTIFGGGAPYVDAASNKGPVTFLLFGVIDAVAAGHPAVVRTALILFAGAAALAVAAYVQHFAGRSAGLMAGVTMAVLAATAAMQGDDPNTEQFGVAPMAGAWYLATRGGPRASAGAGALAAAAALMNPAFALVLPFVAWELWRANGSEARLRRFGVAAVGGAAVAVPVAVWLLATGALDDFRRQVLGQASRATDGALSTGSLLQGSIVESTEASAQQAEGLRFLLDVPAGGLWVAALLGCAVALQDVRLRRVAVPAALWIAVSWLRVKLAVYEFPHHYYTALPGIVAGIAVGVAALWQQATARRVALAGVVLVLASWPYVIAPQWEALAVPPWERFGPDSPFAEQYPVGEFVARNTAPADPIQVAQGHAEIYWVANRRASTRFFDVTVVRQDPEYAAERERELLARPPRAIVLMPQDVLERDLRIVLRREPYRLAYDHRGARVWLLDA